MAVSTSIDATLYQLLNEVEAATYLRLSRSFLRQARCRADGPAYVKLGRSVRYRLPDLNIWLAQRLSTANGGRNVRG